MTDVVIRAENLGKLYHIGERVQHRSLRDVLARSLRAPARLWRRKPANAKEESSLLWALKDVSFEVRQGDVVGILGRNGAGKSTLLKILARVTKPTKGLADIHGRMGTLLEVGTGFHGELTGRENVYLSGAILGMKKAEIQRKFDEIVAFSEVEKFIDTPIKHYSSGMQMRSLCSGGPSRTGDSSGRRSFGRRRHGVPTKMSGQDERRIQRWTHHSLRQPQYGGRPEPVYACHCPEGRGGL